MQQTQQKDKQVVVPTTIAPAMGIATTTTTTIAAAAAAVTAVMGILTIEVVRKEIHRATGKKDHAKNQHIHPSWTTAMLDFN